MALVSTATGQAQLAAAGAFPPGVRPSPCWQVGAAARVRRPRRQSSAGTEAARGTLCNPQQACLPAWKVPYQACQALPLRNSQCPLFNLPWHMESKGRQRRQQLCLHLCGELCRRPGSRAAGQWRSGHIRTLLSRCAHTHQENAPHAGGGEQRFHGMPATVQPQSIQLLILGTAPKQAKALPDDDQRQSPSPAAGPVLAS